MLSYTKLSGNVRRFKTLMGMSLQEFNLLFAKMGKAHPGAERRRPSKRPRGRAIGAGRRFSLDLRYLVLLFLKLDPQLAARVTLIENFASHAAVQEFVDVKPD